MLFKDISVSLSYRDEEGTPSRFFEPDILLPSQYFSVVQCQGSLTPEKKLMLAVIENVMQATA